MKRIIFLTFVVIFFTGCGPEEVVINANENSEALLADTQAASNESSAVNEPIVPTSGVTDNADEVSGSGDVVNNSTTNTGSNTTGSTVDSTSAVANNYVTEAQSNDVPMIPQGLLDSLGSS